MAAKTDQELLHAYLADSSASAFTELVRRYAPMVYGVCMRVARDTHRAETATEATFLVLSRKAHVVAGRRTVSGWLHRIAERSARKVKAPVPYPALDSAKTA